jgi:uncharacterized protein YlaN (UPF0358 family)
MTREREEYLRCLAEDFGLTVEIVFAVAELLGEEEDYDALLTELEEISNG